MGTGVSAPKLSASRDLQMLSDYKSVLLHQILESFNFWKTGALDGRSPLSGSLYDDVFGNLLEDSERHFEYYVPVGQAVCSPLETFMVLVLLAAEDGLEAKVKMALELTLQATGFRQDGEADTFTPADVQKTVQMVLSGMSRIFDCALPPPEDTQASVCLSLAGFNLRAHATLRADMSDEEFAYMSQMHAKSQRPMTYAMVWRWCQDTREVYSYLEGLRALLADMGQTDLLAAMALPDSASDRGSSAAASAAVLPPPQLDFALRQNGVLWRYTIKDMIPSAWVSAETPALYGEDPVFAVLEHLVLMPTKCLPVYLKENLHGGDFVGLFSDVMAHDPSAASLGSVASSASRMGMGSNFASRASLSGSVSKAGMRSSASLAMTRAGSSVGGGGLGSSSSKTASKFKMGGGAGSTSRSSFAARTNSKSNLAKGLSSSNLQSDAAMGTRRPSKTGLHQPTQSTSKMGMSGSIANMERKNSKSDLGSSSSISAFQRKNSKAGLYNPPGPDPHDIFKKKPSVSGSRASNLGLSPGPPGSPVVRGGANIDADKTVVTFLNAADYSTVLAWFAAKCPREITDRFLRVAEEEDEVLGDVSPGQGKQRTGSSYYGSGEAHKGHAGDSSMGGMAAMLPIMVKLKHKVSAAKVKVAAYNHTLWADFGAEVVLSPIGLALEGPHLQRRVQYTLEGIMQTNQHIYNVLDTFAAGYRSIPIASSSLRPHKITHMLTAVDAATFLYYHAPEVFGKTMTKPVSELLSLMRKPVLIPTAYNFGAAATVLAECDCEAALIVDPAGRACGLFKASLVGELWFAWWKQHRARGTEDSYTMDQLQALYLEGEYRPHPLTDVDPKSYSFFMTAQNPLSMCQSVGLVVSPFDVEVGPAEPQDPAAMGKGKVNKANKATLDKATDENGDVSSTSSSGSSNSSTDSDDDSDGGAGEKGRIGKRRKKVRGRKQGKKKGEVGPPKVPIAPKSSSASSSFVSGRRKVLKAARKSKAGRAARKKGGGGSNDSSRASSPAGSRPESREAAMAAPVPTPLVPGGRKGHREMASDASAAAMAAQLSGVFGRIKTRTASHSHVGSSRANFGSSVVLGNALGSAMGMGLGMCGASQIGSVLNCGLSRVEQHDLTDTPDSEAKEGEAWKTEWRAARQHKLAAWLIAHDAVGPGDTLYTALERMHANKTHKVFVVSPIGEPLGVISLADIARDLVQREGKEKVQLHELYSSRKAHHVCIRPPAHAN